MSLRDEIDSGGPPPGSLAGIRVLDVTSNVAGPFATQILGDLGADVIKVERTSGDDCRGWGPPFWAAPRESVIFSGLNRNKRSIALDLGDETDRQIFTRLVATADVLIQSMRPGALEKLGFGWEHVSAVNPRIVYCDLAGFGHEGPRKDQPAYDPLIQAFSGLMSITGDEDGSPVRIPISVLDQGTGMWAAIAILDALRSRDRSQKGIHLEVSLLETALAWQPLQLLGYLAGGEVPKRLGSGTASISPYQAFPTADGHVMVAAGNQRLWVQLCKAINVPELVDDERYRDNAARVTNRADLFEDLSKALRTEPTATWVSVLEEAGVPASAIQTIDRVVLDEQVQATGLVERRERDGNDYSLIKSPIAVDGARYPVRSLPPGLDEHRDEILAELERLTDQA